MNINKLKVRGGLHKVAGKSGVDELYKSLVSGIYIPEAKDLLQFRQINPLLIFSLQLLTCSPVLTNFYSQFAEPISSSLSVILKMSGFTWGSAIPLSPLIGIIPFRSTALSDQVRTAHDVFLYLVVFEIPSSPQVLHRQRSIKIFLTASGQFDGSFRPSLMLSAVTTCFNSSPHEFHKAGSSQATRPSKIESILKLCSNIS